MAKSETTTITPRRIVQIAASPSALFALAKDGTVWFRSESTLLVWKQVPPLPAIEK